MVGEEIEVVVSILELYSPIYEDWYTQEILILKYGEEMTGFMSPYMGLVESMNRDNYLPYEGGFVFQSSMFMSGNSVTKYYENDDLIYTYTINLADTKDISILTTISYPGDQPNEWKHHNADGENYRSLEVDVSLDLIDQVKVDKVYFEAVVTRIDVETGEILCFSSEEPTLTSIRLFHDGVIYNQDGELIALTDIEEGDKIETYYFKRYPSYQPTEIMVTSIRLEE
jgi:hypothetical protein